MTTEGLSLELSDAQREARGTFRRFVQEEIAPHAGRWDRQGEIPRELVEALKDRGWLGAPLSEDVGGGGMDAITYGLLTEEIARGCSSVRSLLTVHDMVTIGVARWGSKHLKETMLPSMARTEVLCALGLTEPEIGSDAAHVKTSARRDGDEWVLSGRKKWITFGQLADLFLILARTEDDQAVAFLVPADAPGFSRTPITGMVGTRASMLAELHLDDCRVPAENVVGRVGFGFTAVVNTVLDHGRYSVAWGAVGIAQASLEACLDYTAEREQFGEALREHQLIRRILTNMIADTQAARLLCCRAGWLRSTGDPGAGHQTLIAKYFASRAAVQAANQAIQVHGANGLSEEYPLERYARDARVTEIIEGSTQIQQITIPQVPPLEL